MTIPWPAIYAGEAVTIRIPNVRDADGAGALNLAAATAIEWQLRRREREPGQTDIDPANPVLVAKDLADGITFEDADILVELEPDDTAELDGRYYADCWVTIAGRRRLAKASAELPILRSVNAP